MSYRFLCIPKKKNNNIGGAYVYFMGKSTVPSFGVNMFFTGK